MICTLWIDEIPESCTEAEVSAELEAEAIEVSVQTLYLLTGRLYRGECTSTLRPCTPPVDPSGMTVDWSEPWQAIRVGGQWLNVGAGCGCHVSWSCGCRGIPQLDLGRGDIVTVDEVKIDGVALDASDYRLDERRLVVRTDGGWWPCCQDLTLADTETGTWSVTVTYGRPAPALLRYAAGVLACEFVKAVVDPSACQLPKNTVSVVRQGITMEMLPFSGEGTGVAEVDAIIRQVNPEGLRQRAKVWTPDLADHRQV